MMPRRVLCRFLLLMLCALAVLRAQAECPLQPDVAAPPTQAEAQAALRVAHDHGFLWRISKEGRTSFLYGTLHVARKDWVYPGPQVLRALRASDTIALELDMLDPAIVAKITAGIQEPSSLVLPTSLVERLRAQAGTLCLQYEKVARLAPGIQMMLLEMQVGHWDGLDATYAIDAVLAGFGHAGKKNVVSLETPELQLALLHPGEDAEELAMVATGLDELESGQARRMLRRIAATWANGDLDELEHYADWCECLRTPAERALMRRTLDERNPGLAEHVDALHAAGKQVFAAVGSLHMIGPLGLPSLLAQRGYRVERVAFSGD